MFILCNALLVFLANYSGLFKSLSSSSSSSPNHDSVFKPSDFGPFSSCPLIVAADEQEIGEKDDEFDERIGLVSQIGGDYDDDDEQDDDEAAAGDEEEEEYGKNDGVMSDEELNRKFDEFIKRMKEEIVVDARRTLVVV